MMATTIQMNAYSLGLNLPFYTEYMVKTTLNYYKPSGDGFPPNPTYFDPPETYVQPTETHEVIIKDVTGHEDEYSLDRTGFQFVPHISVEKEFDDVERIKSIYYPECEKLLKNLTGASRVFIFDHGVRRQQPNTSTQARNLKGPVTRVHVDQSYTSALGRVKYHLPEEADTLLKSRVQIINIWRPIKRVQRDPLAVVDAMSVRENDLVSTAFIFPDLNSETFSVLHNSEHRWYLKNSLKPEEVLIFKIFDSKTDGCARRVPHSAFTDPNASLDAPPRQSVEIRALVFY